MVEAGLDHLPDRGAVLGVLTEQVPAGDVGDAEPLGQALGLCPLPCDSDQPPRSPASSAVIDEVNSPIGFCENATRPGSQSHRAPRLPK